MWLKSYKEMLFFSFLGKVIPNEKVHPRLWKGSDRKFRYINWKNAEKKKQNKVIIDSPWKQPTFCNAPLVSPQNDPWGTSTEIWYWWHVSTQIWAVLLIGCATWEICFQLIRSTIQIWVVTRHQYCTETVFLHLFLRQHFQGKQWWCCNMSAGFSG